MLTAATLGVHMRINKVLIGAFALVICGYALAQSSGGGFEISSYTVDNGGGQSSGGNFILTGTIGQHDAARIASSGNSYLLAGGFWAKAIDRIFSDGFESN